MKKLLSLIALLFSLAFLLCSCDDNDPSTHSHSSVLVEASEPTCNIQGNVGYWKCTECGKYFSDEACTTEITDKASVIISATAHEGTAIHHGSTVADCYNAGNIEYYECTECGKYFSDEACTTEIADKSSVIISATAHEGTTIHHGSTVADCYNAGNIEYYECTECGKYFSDEACSIEIADKASVIIPVAAHEGTAIHHGSTVADCYNAGNVEYYECTACGKYFSDEACTTEITDKSSVIIPVTAHEGTTIHHGSTVADCYNAGNIEYYECTECGKYFSDEACSTEITDKSSVIISPKAHSGSLIYHAGNTATCAENGNIEYWECSLCTDYFENEECTVKISNKASVVLPIEPHFGNMTYYEGKDPTCGKYGYREYWGCIHCGSYFSDAEGTSKLAYAGASLIPPTGMHEYGDDFTCDICENVYSPYTRVSKFTIEFGEYPQYMVDPSYSKELYNKLCSMVEIPTDTNSNGWTSYGYYLYNKVANYMWFIDVTTEEGRYRGVYFSKYRPISLSGSGASDYSSQDEVGFKTDTLYWFEYSTISWTVMKEEDGKALLMCQTIIDSQNFYIDQSSRSNNYAESTIRAWLNDTFYETAFNDLQKRLILLTEVDNSAKTTSAESNKYVCQNTYDYIFLPSYMDMLSSDYGFSQSANEMDTARLKKCTNYAYAMGIHSTSTQQGTMFGDGSYLLRSPSPDYSTSICSVNAYGNLYTTTVVTQTSTGVVPMLWISL